VGGRVGGRVGGWVGGWVCGEAQGCVRRGEGAEGGLAVAQPSPRLSHTHPRLQDTRPLVSFTLPPITLTAEQLGTDGVLLEEPDFEHAWHCVNADGDAGAEAAVKGGAAAAGAGDSVLLYKFQEALAVGGTRRKAAQSGRAVRANPDATLAPNRAELLEPTQGLMRAGNGGFASSTRR
jgi:hypothetical protein